MALNRSYYHDFYSASKRYQYRWIIVPGDDSSYTPVAEPEWGALPDIIGASSTYRVIPDFVIKTAERTGSIGYDTLPIGMPTTSGYNIRVSLTELKRHASTADLADLHTYLKRKTFDSVTLTTVASSPTLEAGNRWILKRGAPGDDIADFVVVYHGIQMRNTELEWNIVSGSRAEIDIKTVDIAEYLTKSMKLEWIGERFNAHGTTHVTDRLYFRVYVDSSVSYAQIAMPRSNTFSSTRFDIYCGTWLSFYYQMQIVLNEAFQLLTRRVYASGIDNLHIKSCQSSTGVARAGVPHDIVNLKRQNYLKNGAATGSIDRSDRYFVANIKDTQDSNAIVAGKCSTGDGSIYGFESLWHWLHDECKTYGARAKYTNISSTVLEIRFLTPGEATTTHDISRSDVLSIGSVVQGRFALAEAKMDRPNVEELDVKSVIVGGDPNATAKWGSTATSEVVPLNGTKNELEEPMCWFYDDLPTHPTMGLMCWPMGLFETMFYRETATTLDAGGSNYMMIAAHHDVTYYNVFAGDTVDYSYALPEDLPTVGAFMLPSAFVEMRDALRGINIEVQANAGFAKWTSQRIMDRFGSGDAAMMELVVRRDVIDHSDHGDMARLVPDVSGDYSARPLLDVSGDDSADGVPGVGHIVSVEPNEKLGQSKIKFFTTTFQ